MPRTLTRRPFPAIRTLLRLGARACLSGPLLVQAQGVCLAPQDRPPCAAMATHSPAAEPGLDLGIGNPVHLVTGEKYLREIDLPEPAGEGHPAFIRRYRSDSRQDGVLGPDWTHDYDIRLRTRAAGWQLVLPDGRRLHFDAQGRAAQGASGQIQISGQADRVRPGDRATHAWMTPDGRRLDFDGDGRLLHIREPGRTPIDIEYHRGGPLDGLPRRIRRGPGSLRPHYDVDGPRPLLRALDTPLGTFHYGYEPIAPNPPDGARRLAQVQRPDGMRRRYHHEAEHQSGHAGAVTGISLVDAGGRHWRARSWAYDARGRVVRAAPGPIGQARDQLEFSYDHAGTASHVQSPRITRVRTATGQAELEHGRRGGHSVIAAVRGASCVDCPATELNARHDLQGRLAALGNLGILRHPGGAIRRLVLPRGGWPGLMLDHDPAGRRTAWSSILTGRTQVLYGPQGRPVGLRHANGDSLDIRLDAAGRPLQLDYAGPGRDPVPVRLQWQGRRLRRLDHPAETERRLHDAQGRLRTRSIQRPHPAGALHYQESFSYDARGRLRRHELPEGGSLHYEWGAGARLTALHWESADGRRHPVITTPPGQAGYRYGNGLHLQTEADPEGRADTLVLAEDTRILWGERRRHDDQGRVLRLDRTTPSLGVRQRLEFAYDAQDRMVGIRADSDPDTTWIAWNEDGGLHDRVPADPPAAIRRDASGLPLAIDGRVLRHQAQRRLAEVRLADGTAVHYTHNAQGHMIRRRQGNQETERYYLDNRLVALWHRPAGASQSATHGAPSFGVSQRYLYAHDVPVGLLQTDAAGHTRLYYLHADLLGTPVLATDAQRRIRWAARHEALGRALPLREAIDLPLRAPGQDEDPATGWHNNVFRTYLPDRGQYLESDPLGPLPGQQALGYAAQQPMRHVDPLGLVLLAFDGTRYGRANQGNVWKLSQLYQDGPAYYHAGPGNNAYIDWDAVTASSSGQILRNQWQSLLNALDQARGAPQPVPIDLLGFSRGAALARDFANRIVRQTRNGWFSYDDPLRGAIGLCVDLRFLGLFDTVAQFGLLGSANAGFDLSIASAWQWVAHAVALHEFRRTFPLVSAAHGSAGNIVEAPFIGAHADIGGGLMLDDRLQPIESGDLSDVALNWMRWQALAAGVPLSGLAPGDQQVTQGLLHDERSSLQRTVTPGDRDLQDSSTRSLGPQGRDPQLGAARRAELETYIARDAVDPSGADRVAGTVDMQGYGAWLETRMGLPGLAGPAQDP